MEITTISIQGYEVLIYELSHGDEFYISKGGNVVYSALTDCTKGQEQAEFIISKWT